VRSKGGSGSIALVRHADKLTLTPSGVLSSIEVGDVNYRERRTLLVLAAEQRRLHLITGRSEWPASCAGAIIALPAVFHSRADERQSSRVRQFTPGMALTAINGAR